MLLFMSVEPPKPLARQNQRTGDDIADIEHLLDDQPTSEFSLGSLLMLCVFLCGLLLLS